MAAAVEEQVSRDRTLHRVPWSPRARRRLVEACQVAYEDGSTVVVVVVAAAVASCTQQRLG